MYLAHGSFIRSVFYKCIPPFLGLPLCFLKKVYHLLKYGAYGVSRDKRDTEYLTNVVNLQNPAGPGCGACVSESVFTVILTLDLGVVLHSLRKTLCGVPQKVLEEREGKV